LAIERTVVFHFPDGQNERRYPMARRYAVGDDVERRGRQYVVASVVEDETDLVVVTLAAAEGFELHGKPSADLLPDGIDAAPAV
jgi:hypothetical protein